MFMTVSWGILTLVKIARGMFCIIKSDYVVSCNSFSINREKLGDYLKWTDYSNVYLISPSNSAHYAFTDLSRIAAELYIVGNIGPFHRRMAQ